MEALKRFVTRYYWAIAWSTAIIVYGIAYAFVGGAGWALLPLVAVLGLFAFD